MKLSDGSCGGWSLKWLRLSLPQSDERMMSWKLSRRRVSLLLKVGLRFGVRFGERPMQLCERSSTLWLSCLASESVSRSHW